MYIFQISELDPAVKSNPRTASVLEGYSFLVPVNNLSLGSIPAVKTIIVHKVAAYRVWTLAWFLYHVTVMSSFTACVHLRVNHIQDDVNSVNNITMWNNVTLTSSVFPGRLFMETFVIAAAVLYAAQEVADVIVLLRRRYWRSRDFSCRWPMFWLTLQFDVYRLFLFVFSASVLSATLSVRLIQSPFHDILYATASVSGWAFLLFFTRTFRNMAFFTLVMQRMVVRELTYFTLAFLTLLLGFGLAMHGLYSGLGVDGPAQVGTPARTFFSMFRVVVGLEELDIADEASTPWFVRFLFFLFVLFSNIMLLNMLIAAMNNTYNEIAPLRDVIWLQLRLKAVLLIERRLPCWLRPKHGLVRSNRDHRDMWFLGSSEVLPGHPLTGCSDV